MVEACRGLARSKNRCDTDSATLSVVKDQALAATCRSGRSRNTFDKDRGDIAMTGSSSQSSSKRVGGLQFSKKDISRHT